MIHKLPHVGILSFRQKGPHTVVDIDIAFLVTLEAFSITALENALSEALLIVVNDGVILVNMMLILQGLWRVAH